MNYNTALLKTAAECDAVIASANREKKNLEVKKVVLTNSLENLSLDSQDLSTELAIVNGDIATYQNVIATLADGKRKDEYMDKLTTAQYKLHLLTKKAGKKGAEQQLDDQLDLADIESAIANREALITAVTARKAEL